MDLKPLPNRPPPATSLNAESLRMLEPLCSVFRRKLKSVGLKYTPERAYILDAIIRRDDESGRTEGRGAPAMKAKFAGGGSAGGGGVFEADELLESMRKAGFRVSKATIYRTIKLLAEAGIIQQVLFDGDQAHYQLAYGKRSSGLLIDVDTKRIIPVEIPELALIRDRVCREHGLAPEGHRVVIYGRGKA